MHAPAGRSGLSGLIGTLVAAVLLAGADVSPAPRGSDTPPGGRIAVVMLGAASGDREIADNLTDVIIARLAHRGNDDIVGTTEFRGRVGLEDGRQERACLDVAVCVDRVAVSLGAAMLLSGTIAAKPDSRQYTFSLTLRNLESGEIQSRVWRSVAGSLQDVIRSVNQAIDELYAPKPSPARFIIEAPVSGARVLVDDAFFGTTPKASGDISAGRRRIRVEASGRRPWASQVDAFAGATVAVKLSDADIPRHPVWPRPAAYGLGAGAILSFGSAAVLGIIANVQPATVDRAEAQRDFQQRHQIGGVADGFLVAGVVLAVASGLIVWTHRHDILDRDP